MRLVTGFFFSLVVSLTAEVRGWKVAESWLESRGAEKDEWVRLDEVPFESAFFGGNDELWDLRDAFDLVIEWSSSAPGGEGFDPFDSEKRRHRERVPFVGDSLVWNRTRSTVVARGPWDALENLDDAIGLSRVPKVVEVTMEVREGEARVDPASLSVITRSGEIASIAMEGRHLEVAPVVGADGRWIDLNLAARVNKVHAVTTSLSMRDGESKCFAGWNSEGNSWDASIRAEVRTIWDTPFRGVRLIEHRGGVTNYDDFRELDERIADEVRAPEGMQVRVFDAPIDLPERMGCEHLEWMENSPGVIDVSDAFRSHGVPLEEEGALAMFHRAGAKLVVVANDGDLEIVEMILMPVGGCGSVSTLRVEVFWDGGSAMLRSRSGEKSSIAAPDSKSRRLANRQAAVDRGSEPEVHAPHPGFEVAPNLGSAGRLVDINYFLSLPIQEFELNSAATLEVDSNVRIAGTGEDWELRMKATVDDPH